MKLKPGVKLAAVAVVVIAAVSGVKYGLKTGLFGQDEVIASSVAPISSIVNADGATALQIPTLLSTCLLQRLVDN